MTEQVIIAGAGGQGIMLLGKVLAESVMREGKFVTWFPAYGAEVRGGTAYCMVVISDEEISSPDIRQADTLIVMNGPSLEKFQGKVKNNGLVIINTSLAQPGKSDKRHIKHPFTDMALKLGNVRVANMMALGSYLAHKKIIDIKTVVKVIEDIAPANKKDLVAVNQRALKEGYALNGKG